MARQIWISGEYEDDRGRRHKPRALKGVFRSFVLSSGRDGLSPAQAYVCSGRSLMKRTMWSPRMQMFFMISGGLAVGFGGAWYGWRGVSNFAQGHVTWWELLFVLVASGTLITVAVTIGKIDRCMVLRELENISLGPPACLVCGYELAGLAAEHDGCTVCPECGGAWRVEGMFAELRT